jgi:hypothetical protein
LIQHEISQRLEALAEVTERLNEREEFYLSAVTELSGFMLTCPKPCWIKGIDGVMIYVNDCYESEYGIEPHSYTGSKDNSVWKPEEAWAFKSNDDLVLSTMTGHQFSETVYNPAQKQKQILYVLKWPIRVGGRVLGVAGMVLESVDADEQ